VLPAPRAKTTSAYSDAAWERALRAHGQREKAEALEATRGFLAQLDAAQPEGPKATEAFWLNAYDALALERRLSTGKPPGRVWRALWPHAISGRWLTLDGVERRLRASGDPRIYFALTLGRRGDPELPEAPFRAGTLDAQLNAAARRYLDDSRHVRIEDGVLHLAPLLGGELRALAERDASQRLVQLVWTFLPRECQSYPGCVTRAALDRACGPHLDACPLHFDAAAPAR
jgi:hypothetical protein